MKKILFSIFSVILCLSVFSGLLATGKSVKAETQNKMVTDLFFPSEMTLDPMTIDEELTYLDKGLKIVSKSEQSSIVFRNDFTGEFSIEYLPVANNGECSIRVLEFDFLNKSNDDKFTFVIEHGETINAYIKINGIKAGIFYPAYNYLSGTTEFCNRDNLFTRFTAEKVRLEFNPDDMSVSVGSADGLLSLVWSLTNPVNDKRDIGVCLQPFAEYNVSFTISDYLGETGGLILYKLNDCPLDNIVLSSSGTPSIFADFKTNGVVGQKFYIPQANIFDLKDGTVDYSVSVFDAKNLLICKDVSSFVPSSAGEYFVSYYAINSEGIEITKKYSLEVYNVDNIPTETVDLEWDLKEEYFSGDRVYLPESRIFGGLNRYGERKGKLSIYKNGVKLIAYSDRLSGFYMTFSSVGEYEIEYEGVLDKKIVQVSNTTLVGETDNLKEGQLLDVSKMKLLDNGVEYPFTFQVRFPDGKLYNNKKILIDQTGNYDILAHYVKNGVEKTLIKTFTVAKTSADLFTSGSQGFTSSFGKSLFSGREGVSVSVTDSNTLINFVKPINLSEYSNQSKDFYTNVGVGNGNYELVNGEYVPQSGGSYKYSYTGLSETAKPLIELQVDANAYGKNAASSVYVYLTDANNPDNKITVFGATKYNSSWWTYIRANAPEQKLVGMYNSTSGDDVITLPNGMQGRLGETGFMTAHSFMNKVSSGNQTTDSKFILYYDNDEKQILTLPQKNSSLQNHIIMDFDDWADYAGTPWGGFTSDKAYLSIMISGLSAPHASATIYTADGIEFTSKDLVYNADGITYKVDSPNNIKGLEGQSIVVPSITAFNKYGETINNILAKVYYDYQADKSVHVPIVNGEFTTHFVGKYRIVYTISDSFGNEKEHTIYVDVQKLQDVSPLTLFIGDPAAEYLTGEVAKPVKLYNSNAEPEGYINRYDIIRTVYYIDNGQKIEVDVVDNQFIPTRAGSYLVEFKAIDGVGRSVVDDYTITVDYPEEIIITSNIPVYFGFVSGNTYDFADLYFIDYNTDRENAVERKAELYINNQKITGNSYLFPKRIELENSSELLEYADVEYRYNDVVIKSYEQLPIKTVFRKVDDSIDLGGGIILPGTAELLLHERYFVGESGISGTVLSENVIITSNSNQAKLTFIQPISSEEISVVFNAFAKNGEWLANGDNVGKISIVLTDALNENNYVEVCLIENENGNLIMSADGGKSGSIALSGVLAKDTLTSVSIKYFNASRSFFDVKADGSTARLLTINDNNGKPFDGFSNSVYLSLMVEGKNTDIPASVYLSELNGQKFSFSKQTRKDTQAPFIAINGALSGIFSVGDVVDVFSASASDVLSGINYETLKVSVVCDNDGVETFVKDNNGLLLKDVPADRQYQITLSNMGTYSYNYYVEDSAGNSTEISIVLTVLQRKAPKITVSKGISSTIGLKQYITVPKATVSYISKNSKNLYYVIAIKPDGSYITVENGKVYADRKGTYVIRYYAIDAYGNSAYKEYKVQCN